MLLFKSLIFVISFKALENKPQSYFRIQLEHRSPSDWKSVSEIISEGVGRSTLPSVKLRAIVEAAKEITRLHSEERGCFSERSFFDGPVKTKTLGADDFLPIFIFCFVQAKLDRPCALCKLLIHLYFASLVTPQSYYDRRMR